MNIQRLTRLIKILRRVDPEHFNIKSYYRGLYDPRAGAGIDVEDYRKRVQLECGTNACAIGYACLDPVFIKEGLKLSTGGSPIFNNSPGRFGIAKFFDIDDVDAAALFYPDEYTRPSFYPTPTLDMISPNMVADKLQELIDTGAMSNSR